MLGLSASAIEEALGPPPRRRREPPAEVWQYHAHTCVVDVYLYPPSQNANLAVRHVETRRRDAPHLPSPACMKRILEAQSGSTPLRRNRQGLPG